MKASVIGTGFGSSVVARIYEAIGIETEVVSPRDNEAVKRACAAPVDFVSIHSPPFMHREHVGLALAAGRHVVCDKPFGMSALESRAMLDEATAAGVIHLLNFEYRHDAARSRIKTLLEQGAIGEVRHINWAMYTAGSRAMPYGWLFDRAQGGGWIGAYGSHVIDALRWLVGEIEQADGVCRTELGVRPDKDGQQVACTAEDAFSATFRFRNGATGVVDTAFAASVTRGQKVEIFGSDGVLVLDGGGLTLMRQGRADEAVDFAAPAGDAKEPAFHAWALLMRDAIRDGRQIEPSFRDGLACALVMDQLRVKAV